MIAIWSQWYFALLLAPWARINMLYDWQLPYLPQSIKFTQSGFNAGIRLVHGFNMAQQHGADITLAVDFLSIRTLPDGTSNRLYQPLREIPQPAGPPKIIRRLCCLRYKPAGLEYCPSCPLVETQQRKAGRCR